MTKTFSITPESHLDHLEDLTDVERAKLLEWLDSKVQACPPRSAGAVLVLTCESSPVELFCNLHGPAMGDVPVPESDVEYRVRPGRPYASRIAKDMLKYPSRFTSTVTIIVGPRGEHESALCTVYGGPAAPREPGDTSIESWDELLRSRAFWAEHALR